MRKILAIDDKKDNLISLSALLPTLIGDCVVIAAQGGADLTQAEPMQYNTRHQGQLMAT